MANEQAPMAVYRFHVLWLAGMLIGAAYDLMVAVVGDSEEATIDIVLFLGAAALLFYATHRRSNLARWLLVPFLLITVSEVFAHDRALSSGPVVIGLLPPSSWQCRSASLCCSPVPPVNGSTLVGDA